MSYSAMLDQIVALVGGVENVDGVQHCVTRLRFRLKDEGKADLAALGKVDGTLGAVQSNGQTQVIIGTHVGDVYDELVSTYQFGGGLKDASSVKAEMSGQKVKSSLIDVISGLFTPLLTLMTATGLIKGVLALLQALGVLSADAGLYILLNAVGDSFFYFLPIFVGYTAMRRFGGTPAIGALMGAALVYPDIINLANAESIFTILEGSAFALPVKSMLGPIPLVVMSYSSTVIPIIFICAIAAPIEKWLNGVVPPLVKSFVAPACTLVISMLIGFTVVGPVINLVSNMLGAFMVWLFSISSVVSGFIYGFIIQITVIFGVHWGFVAIAINNLATMGHDPVTICGMTAGLSFAGVCLAIILRSRDSRLKNVAIPALVSSLVGITEPAVYGIALQRRKSFAIACLATGIGGAIIGAFGTAQYNFGVNGLFAWLQVIPETGFDSTVTGAIIAMVVSFVIAFGLMMALWPKLDMDEEA